jgi:peptide/nickel transport system ATP-binding protein
MNERILDVSAHEELLTVRDLHTWFELRKFGFIKVGNVRAVDGVNFQLRRGEAIAVVGESGCGKSTLAKTILGLVRPVKGEVIFDGKRIDDRESLAWYRKQVGFVQQDPYGALPPFMNVEQILNEPMLINGVREPAVRRQRIRDSLTELKLTPVDDFLPKYPHMLSGGQQQRVVIARARILEPQFIVADEPVSMLDASVRIEILELLRKVQVSHNLGVLYITHDLSTVRYFSERIFVMYGAMLVEMADVESILAEPLHPYTVALLEAIPDPDAENARKYQKVPPGEPPSLLHPPAGCRFHPRCPHKMDGLCDRNVPPEFEPKPEHYVKCWLYGEQRSEA